MRPLRLSLLLVAASHPSPPLQAWDYFGHHVVGAIAWERMDEPTRRAAAELLLLAPPDSDLPPLLPPGPRPLEARWRELFVMAQGWADMVRDEAWGERKEKYDRPVWHYVNRFWTPSPSGPLWLEERGTLGELVLRLEEARRQVAEAPLPAPERALALAWVLHLVGDVHQPLHSSARVTPLDPDGDRGGNDFELDDPEASNLHFFWDSILRRSRRQYHSESYLAWVARIASEISGLHPASSLSGEIENDAVAEWSRAGAAIAAASAYPDDLVRGAAPSRRYQERVFSIATRQAALGGYRLARLVNDVLVASPHLALPSARP